MASYGDLNTSHKAFMSRIRESALKPTQPGVSRITRRTPHHLAPLPGEHQRMLAGLIPEDIRVNIERPADFPQEGDFFEKMRYAERKIEEVSAKVAKNFGAISNNAKVAAAALVVNNAVKVVPGQPYYLSALKQGIAKTAKEDAEIHKFITERDAYMYKSALALAKEIKEEIKRLEEKLVTIKAAWELKQKELEIKREEIHLVERTTEIRRVYAALNSDMSKKKKHKIAERYRVLIDGYEKLVEERDILLDELDELAEEFRFTEVALLREKNPPPRHGGFRSTRRKTRKTRKWK